MDAKELIARRVALELHDWTLVNLGIGLPTLVARYVPPGIRVAFQSENGIIGFGARPPEGMEDPDLVDAGGGFVGAVPGACSLDSATSFALIRGGHLDMTVLGGLQVDVRGRLANWMVPGTMVAGMGGAMAQRPCGRCWGSGRSSSSRSRRARCSPAPASWSRRRRSPASTSAAATA